MAVHNSNSLGEVPRSEQVVTRSEQQSLSVAVQSSRNEPSATANAITTDLQRFVNKVDNIEEEVGATKKIVEKTNTQV